MWVLDGYEVISAMREVNLSSDVSTMCIYARSVELKSLPNVVRPFFFLFIINHSLSLEMLKYVSRKKK